MKNEVFGKRLRFALRGLRVAWVQEKSFRTQGILALGAIAILVVRRPAPIWWAIFFLVIGAVLAAELFNTALELVIDRVHPEIHPMIAKAKDCAAAAVLILSLTALAVLVLLLLPT